MKRPLPTKQALGKVDPRAKDVKYAERAVPTLPPGFDRSRRPWWLRYGVSVGAVLLGLALGVAVRPAGETTSLPFILFFSCILLGAWYGRLGPALLVLVVSTLAMAWFFIEPRYRLDSKEWRDVLALLLFLGGGLGSAMAIESMHRASARAWTELAGLTRWNADLHRRLSERTAMLREKTSRLAETEKIAKIGSWEWDIPRDRVTWSDGLLRIYGLTRETFKATSQAFLERLPPEDRTHVREVIRQACLTREPFDFYHRVVRPDGAIRLLHGRGSVVLDPSGRPVRMFGTGRDVTEEKKLEERARQLFIEKTRAAELEASKARQTFLAEAGAILSPSLDLTATLEKVAELVVRHLADWWWISVTGPNGSPGPTIVSHRNSEKVPWVRDLARRRPTPLGSPPGPPDDLRSGKPRLHPEISLVTLKELAQDEDHFRLLAAVGTASAMVVPVVAVGRTMATMIFVAGDSGRRFGEADLELAEALADRTGRVLENACLFQDAKRHEAEIQRLNADLDRRVRERTAELEAFAYAVAHDLRAPLRAMQGFADLILQEAGPRLEPTERDYVGRIGKAADRMDTLVRDLLAYSRLGFADVTSSAVDVESLVQDVLRQMEPELRDRRAEVRVEAGIPPVLGHRPTLFQVISNLVSNAAKFVQEGVPPRIRIAARIRRRWVRLIIEDNGIGIAPQYREKIFHVFERLHGTDPYPGTGMGLAIVRRAIQRMGGRAGVEPREVQGSRFWVELPYAAAESDSRAREEGRNDFKRTG